MRCKQTGYNENSVNLKKKFIPDFPGIQGLGGEALVPHFPADVVNQIG